MTRRPGPIRWGCRLVVPPTSGRLTRSTAPTVCWRGWVPGLEPTASSGSRGPSRSKVPSPTPLGLGGGAPTALPAGGGATELERRARPRALGRPLGHETDLGTQAPAVGVAEIERHARPVH